MDNKLVLVTGAAGMVGSYVPEVFEQFDLKLTDIQAGYEQLDVRNPKAVMQMVSKIKPHVVLHLAAVTDVDLCEKEPDQAYHTNAIGVQNIAVACQETGSLLVYISTGGVFPGDKQAPYTEFDLPGARNVYGDSKWQGEKIVSDLLDRFLVCRTGWMFGGGKKDKKFVGKITKLIHEGKNPLRAVDDKFGSPTYAKDLLRGIRQLLESPCYGLYHLANNGFASRYDMAKTIRDILGMQHVTIEPVSSAYFPLPAPRAPSEKLRNYKLELLGMNDLAPWQEALKEYLSNELVPAIQSHNMAV
jgi:dTDP-4-dehydrorhamnose reductase